MMERVTSARKVSEKNFAIPIRMSISTRREKMKVGGWRGCQMCFKMIFFFGVCIVGARVLRTLHVVSPV